MGCCQSNLSTSTNPHDRKKFIDHIKQSSLDSNEKSHLINNQPPQLQRIPQSSQSYQYSKHGMSKCEQFEDSQVSIFQQQRKRLQQRSRKRLHVEIHPDIIEKENRRQIQQLLRQSQLINGSNSNKKGTIFPMQQQLLLSNIRMNNDQQAVNKNNRNVFEQQEQYQKQQSQLMSNFQQQMANILLMLKQNNSNGANSGNNNNRVNSQTDRQLMQLHGQLTTMIILWEKLANGTKRLKVQQMNTKRSNNNNKQQLENNQKVTKQQQNQQQHQYINKQKDNTDKQLLDIWNDQHQQQNIVQPQQQQNNTQNNNNNKQLNNKQQVVNNRKQTLPNKLTKTQQQTILKNNNIDLHDHLPITTNQQPINNNTQQISKSKHTFQNLSLNKSSSSQQQSKQQQQQQSKQQEQQSKQQQQYSKCLLSNPTKILNDSLVSQFNQQKQLFYFGNNNNNNQTQPNKYYQKWIQTDRKAYQIKNQDILSLFNQKRSNKYQSRIKNVLLALLCVIKGYKQLNRVNLIAFRTLTSTSIFFQSQHNKLPKQSGFKIFYNGIKRLYPFQQQFDGTDLFSQLFNMFINLYNQQQINLCNNQQNNQHNKQKNSSQLLYNLTGWIPQTIMVNEISSYQGVFQRLNTNFIDGNTVITFTGRQNQIWGLKSIDIQKKQIKLYGNNKQSQITKEIKSIQQFEYSYKWSDFINIITQINVNWNPLIYDFVWKTQNVFYFDQLEWNKKDTIYNFDQDYIQSISHQYLLKIPPSQDDIQVRVFIQVHYGERETTQSKYHGEITQCKNKQNNDYQDDLVIIQLHDYSGYRVNSSNSAIRTVQKNKKVYSDMFIFQSSKQKNQYVLAVRPLNKVSQKIRSEIKYTISAFTFIQVSLQQIPITRVIQQKVISTYLQQSHCGYGINSPHFLNNFYLQLKIPPLQKIKIFVSMPVKDCKFQLNLIANPDGEENLTRLNLQNILGDIITSQQFQQGKGYLQIETKYQQYFFMITNHTKCKGQFNIIIQVIQNIPKYLTLKKLQQIQSNIKINDKQLPSLIYSKQKFFYQQPIFTKQFKWLPTHTGPRKRLKSNTHSGFQPFAAFKQFFKNPFIDYKVDKYKKLQFSVYSKSYLQYFDSLQQDQNNQAQPPTISLTILKVKRPNQIISTSQKNISNQSLFKIIVDDAFYVPFGFGFWTKILEIQAGQYRFVFPKMEKQLSQGVFNVYHIEK